MWCAPLPHPPKVEMQVEKGLFVGHCLGSVKVNAKFFAFLAILGWSHVGSLAYLLFKSIDAPVVLFFLAPTHPQGSKYTPQKPRNPRGN